MNHRAGKDQNVTKQKAQGIVEYALLLAFVVGIAMILNGGDLGGAVKGVFDGTSSSIEKNDPRRIAAENDRKARLAADQNALVNLASFFIGKTRDEMRDLLNGNPLKRDANGDPVQKTDKKGNPVYDKKGNPVYIREDGSSYTGLNDGTNYTGSPIGWFVSTDTGMHFITKELTSDGVYTFSSGDNAYTRPTQDQVFNWVQGDYGEGGSYNLSYDSTYRYLVSDYPSSQFERTDLTYKTDPLVGGNGVKMRVQYKNNVVTGVKLAVDQGSQKKENGSAGLEVTVLKTNDGNKTYLTSGYDANFDPKKF